MKIKAGKDDFTMPPFGEILNVFWRRHDGLFIQMNRISQEHMAAARKTQSRGTPTYFSIDDDRNGLIFPAPDVDCTLQIRYYPPAREV